MTREEVIDSSNTISLKEMMDKLKITAEDIENAEDLEYSIEPLIRSKNNLEDDYISRRQAIAEANYLLLETSHDNQKVIEMLENLPSITPQELRWILVSEKLPDPGENVLVTVNLGSVNVVGTDMYSLVEKDGFEGYGKDVIAWMSLPKPYEPQESEDK